MAIKILYVITKASWGGAQHYVYDLAVAAKGAGKDVAVAVGGTGPLTERLQQAGVRVIELPLRQQETFLFDVLTFDSLFSLIRIFRSERPDIVHTNSAKAGGLGALAARLSSVSRIVFTAHGWEFNAPRSGLSRIGIRFFSWVTILLSHTTICVSDAVRRDVMWMPWTRRKLVVIHNGVMCEVLLRGSARQMLNSQTKISYWIGMLSELHPTKRVDDAIRAFAPLAARHTETGLFVISEGKERKKLELLIQRLRLEDRVFLLGYIPDAPKYFSAFDMFIHSSQSEALALAILEAGCAELPVIATRVGGIPEMIRDGQDGLLVPPRDPGALTQAIETLYANPEKARMFASSFSKRVKSEFTKTEMVRATLALYSSVQKNR